jgi:hypothetical protein
LEIAILAACTNLKKAHSKKNSDPRKDEGVKCRKLELTALQIPERKKLSFAGPGEIIFHRLQFDAKPRSLRTKT